MATVPHVHVRDSAEEGHTVTMPAMRAVTTIEELLALPEDGQRHELLYGVHVVTPAPAYGHQDVLKLTWAADGEPLLEQPVKAFIHTWRQQKSLITEVAMKLGVTRVERTGIEPVTPCLQSRCSPN